MHSLRIIANGLLGGLETPREGAEEAIYPWEHVLKSTEFVFDSINALTTVTIV